MADNEADIREQIGQLDEEDPSMGPLLCDLAQLQLDKGNVQEAQKLFERVYELRKQDLGPSASGQPEGVAHASGGPDGHAAANGDDSSHSVRQGTSPAACCSDDTDDDAPPGLGPTDESAVMKAEASGQTTTRKAAALNGAAAALHGAATAVAAADAGPAAASSSGHNGSATGHEEQDSDDWETGGAWSLGLSQLKAADEFAPASTAATTKATVRGRGAPKASLANRTEPEWHAAAPTGARNLTHIVEIYELSRAVKSEDLERFLADYAYMNTTPNIRWVDDEHALAVFPNEDAAQVLLDSKQWKYKVRPYVDASMGALLMPMEELAAPKTVRPKTTATIARRLIGHALGDARVRDKEGERQLAQLRREKKEERKQRQAAAAAVWDGD